MIQFLHVIPRLPVTDLRRTLAFYAEVLGFSIDLVWPSDRPTFAILQRDTTRVSFFEPNEHQGAPGYAELYVEVTEASELYALIHDRVAIEWGPEVYSYGRREFAARDPDRYLVIFTEPTSDPYTTRDPE